MFMRPTTPEVHAERTAVDGACPACGDRSLQRYRVLSEGGWWNVGMSRLTNPSMNARESGPVNIAENESPIARQLPDAS